MTSTAQPGSSTDPTPELTAGSQDCGCKGPQRNVMPASRAAHAPLPVAPRLSHRPGSLLAWLIFRTAGAVAKADCDCAARRKVMDEWGWRGCWQQRREIVGWVVAEARLRGHVVDERKVLQLLKAAFLEVRRRPRAIHPLGSAG